MSPLHLPPMKFPSLARPKLTGRGETSGMSPHTSHKFATSLVHLLIRGLMRVAYRIERPRHDAIPSRGPALIIANHVSYIDSLLLAVLCRRAPRFVMHAHWVGALPWARWLFAVTGVIPIASRREQPDLFRRAFEDIDAALASGELVVIFPEGRLTDDGELGEFRRGLEHVLARRAVPVVPVALGGLWGSIWSKHPARWRIRLASPRRRRLQVVVAPQALAEASAQELHAQVSALLRSGTARNASAAPRVRLIRPRPGRCA